MTTHLASPARHAAARSSLPALAERVAHPQRYLLCRPSYFDVVYEINPWMHVTVDVDQELAMRQWNNLVDTYRRLGHTVEIMDGVPGQPDMVFTANAATVVGDRAVMAKFSTPKRTGEEDPYAAWMRDNVGHVVIPTEVNEGEGDLLWTGRLLLAGSGFRTDRRSHHEIAEALGVPVVGLLLVDPAFYHLDTALTILGHEQVAYYPAAFSSGSQEILRRLYPDAIEVSRTDAEWFALNAVSDGKNVVVPEQAPDFAAQLEAAGYQPVPVDISEFRKAGGGAKCCTLVLRD